MDYSEIVLTQDEKKIFHKFKHSDNAHMSIDEFNIISKTGLIKSCIDGKDPFYPDSPQEGTCELSEYGKRYKAYLFNQYKHNRKESRKFWIPYLITTAIAVTGLVNSILARLHI